MIKAIKLIFINILVIFTAFLILEGLARTYVHFFIEGKSFFRESTFISPWITAYDYPAPLIDNNNKGIFRHKNTPVPMSKPDSTVRIIALGGSTTLNQRPYQRAGIDYSIVLERLLNEGSDGLKKYEVLNAGSDAYSSAHSLVNLQFRLVEFNPDYLLLMHNINDLTVNYFKDGATGDYENKYMESYFINPELQAAHSFTGLLFQSRLLTKLGLPEFLASKRSIDYTNDIEEGARIFERNLKYISLVCAENNIKLIYLTQPNNMKDYQFEGQDQQILKYNEIVRSVAGSKGDHLIDMFSLFGHEDGYFIDPVHYTPDGIKRFSEILYKKLRALFIEIDTSSNEGVTHK